MDSVAVPSPTLTTTFAAVAGGNLSGDGTALVHHTFGLFWCGTGYLELGSCSGGDDVVFGYIPNPTDSNINQLQSFASAHPDWVATIESRAFNSFKAAFGKYAIVVNYGTKQDFTAYIVGTWPTRAFALDIPGGTTGRVFYLSFMDEAQTAAGYPNGYGQGPDCGHTWCRLSPNYPPTTQDDITALQKLIPAIGTAIGNAAAHEAGHYLQGVQAFQGKVFPLMDCGLANTKALNGAIACQPDALYPAGDNFVYNFFSGASFSARALLRKSLKCHAGVVSICTALNL